MSEYAWIYLNKQNSEYALGPKGVFIWEKTFLLQLSRPSASVSWDDFNFRLHE